MLLEEQYPHLKNPSKSEWRVVVIRSLILVLLSILITAAAYIFKPKKDGNATKDAPQTSASTRGGAADSYDF